MLTRIFVVTNIPAPYRVPVFDLLSSIAREQEWELMVAYVSDRERGRYWEKPNLGHAHCFLCPNSISPSRMWLHPHRSLFEKLAESNPSLIIAFGYDPLALQAFCWAKIHHVLYITVTDGTMNSERGFGMLRRAVRSLMIRRSDACIGASLKSIEFFKHYGASSEKCFRSCLCTDNGAFFEAGSRKKHDLLYVAHISHRKMPDLLVDIMADLGRGYSLQVVGDGPARGGLIKSLQRLSVDFEYTGFLQPPNLQKLFRESKLLLFPTRRDAWGLVANEGCASGLPVITTEEAGAAGELIIHGRNGYVLPPVAKVWAEYIRGLLSTPELYAKMSRNSREMVEPFNVEAAARGFMDAVLYALKQEK